MDPAVAPVRRSAAHRPIDAIENNEERVAAGLNDPTPMFVYRRVDYACAYRAKSFHGTDII
jgi:hypothetical protein